MLASAARARARARPMLRRLGATLLDAVLPRRCLACGTIIEAAGVETAGALCADCWPKLRFITAPYCATCGTPFTFEIGEGAVCAACAAAERPFARVRAAIAYDDASRGLILALKHADRTDAARAFAPWMLRAGRVLLADADLVTAVPLHWTRLFVRRYNQAALLAQAVGRLAGARVVPDLLVRRKRTPPLGNFGARERAQTVRGAFAVPPQRRAEVEGRRILLVDDVYTTGSTTGACARALTRAGARAVDILALARVVRPEHAPAARRTAGHHRPDHSASTEETPL